MGNHINFEQLQNLAHDGGIELVGMCDLTELKAAQGRLRLWQESGHAGEMRYMQRPPEMLTTIEHLLPGAKSVLSCTLRYSQAPHPARPQGFGRIARYAWGRDYHLVIPTLLRQLVERTEQLIGRKISSRVFSDALPFLERAGAHSAGLGFIGKNTMLIRKGVGSFFFIAEILWDIEVNQVLKILPQSNSCGSCNRCLNDCPTNAFVEPFVLHAPRCISYMTIEKRGVHTVAERRAIGEWLFGCDICQDVCPFNHAALKKSAPPGNELLTSSQGTGPLLNLGEILSIRSNREFESRFAETPLLRAGKVGLQRNALAVAANTVTLDCSSIIHEIGATSSSGTLRATALWALSELHRHEPIPCFTDLHNKLRKDPDQLVRQEAERLEENS